MNNISFNVEKVKEHEVSKYRIHIKREANEYENEMIDLTRAHLNLALDLGGTFDERFENRKNARRKNKDGSLRKIPPKGTVLLAFIFQLSPERLKGMSDEQKVREMRQLGKDIYPWVVANFGGAENGADNIVYFDGHMDETNPHFHVGVVPIASKKVTYYEEYTEKKTGKEIKREKTIHPGSLNAKAYINGSAHLRSLHQDLRTHLNDRGWEVDAENKYENAKGVPLREYKRNKPQIDKAREEHTALVRGNKALQEESEQLAEAHNVQLAQQQKELDTLIAATAQANIERERAMREAAEAEETARKANVRRAEAESQANATERDLKVLEGKKEQLKSEIRILDSIKDKIFDILKKIHVIAGQNEDMQKEFEEEKAEDSLSAYVAGLKKENSQEPRLTPPQLKFLKDAEEGWRKWRKQRMGAREAKLEKNAQTVRDIDISHIPTAQDYLDHQDADRAFDS